MAKKVKAVIVLQLKAQQASPAPPVGPALAQHGINLPQFCKDYNARTGSYQPGEIVPAEITVFQDGSFKFALKSPPTAYLIKKVAGIPKGAGAPPNEKVGKLTRAQVREIAETKMKDMNAIDIEGAMRQVEGTARNMGVSIVD